MKRIAFWIPAAFLAALAICLALAGAPARAYPTGWTLQREVYSSGVASCDIEAYGDYAWAVYRRADGSIWLKRSTDRGANWGSAVCIENNVFDNESPVVVLGSAARKYVYVIWAGKRDGGGYYQTQISRSDDMGATFRRVYHSTGSSNKTSHDACRLPDANIVIFAWAEDNWGTSEVNWGRIATDGTVTPGDTRSAKDGIDSRTPSVACFGYSEIFIVWKDEAGGAYSRSHLVCDRSVNCGANWKAPGSGVLPYDARYRQAYPTVSWDINPVVVVYRGQEVDSGDYFVGRYYFSTMGSGWNPGNVADSRVVTTGSSSAAPRTLGRQYSDVFYKSSAGGLAHHQVATDVLGTKALAGGTEVIATASNVPASDAATDYVAAVSSDGKLYMRRKDTTAPRCSLSAPTFNGSNPAYAGGSLGVECSGAADDFDVSGTDIATGVSYRNGIEKVSYEYSLDGATWNALPCVGGGSASKEPPFSRQVDCRALDQRKVRLKAKSVDSAGNVSEAVAPAWTFIDGRRPVTSAALRGTGGDRGWFRSGVDVTLTARDFTYDFTEYRLENLATGRKDVNWTRYSRPFRLGEGRWKVTYRSRDRSGNVEATRSRCVNVDTTRPTCSLSRPSKETIQTGYRMDESFRVEGSGTDANGLAWGAIYIDGRKVHSTRTDFDMSYGWELDGVSEGTHRIEVRVSDRAGNTTSSGKNVYVGNVAKDWYFAEGNTLPEFDEYICIVNPGDSDARVKLSFVLETGQVVGAELAMAPHQRQTVNVKDYVEQGHHVSTLVHCSERAIIAERSMYFVYKGVWKGGHDCMGINALQNEYYFAEGTTRKNPTDGEFEEWLCLMNPDWAKTANVTITYMLAGGSNIVKQYQVAPHSRCTVEVASDVGLDQDVSAKVVSDIPVAAERPMYFNYHQYAVGGSDVVGAPAPSRTWFFAEGCTYPGFQEWLTLQNPSDVPADVEITYMTGAGKVTRARNTVPPRSRATVDVLSQVGDNQEVSARVDSGVPIVAERPMYFIYGAAEGKGWTGGEAAMGTCSPATTYYFAEGCTSEGFNTYYTLQNPADEGCEVDVRYVFGDGTTMDREYSIGAHSRLTIDVNAEVGRPADVSASITATHPVIVERPMYYNYHGNIAGGHVVCGHAVD